MPYALSPLWVKALVLAALVAAVLAWDAHRIGKAEERGREEVRAEWALERDKQHSAALLQAAQNAAETERRLKAQKATQDAHDQAMARARADADAARVAAGRLSRQLAEFAAAHRRTAGNPAAAGHGQAAADPIGVLADVLGQLDQRAGELAAHADAARAAGLQCEAAYGSLTSP